MLDKAGQAAGTIRGQFVLTRQKRRSKALDDASLRGIALEPNEDNTLLLYDNPTWEFGFSIRAAGMPAACVADNSRSTPPAAAAACCSRWSRPRVPTGVQFMAESRGYLLQQHARILGESRVRQLPGAAGILEQFALDVKIGGKRDDGLLRDPAGRRRPDAGRSPGGAGFSGLAARCGTNRPQSKADARHHALAMTGGDGPEVVQDVQAILQVTLRARPDMLS